MPRWVKIVLGVLLLAVGIILTAFVISAEIGIPMAIAGIAMLSVAV